MARIRQLDAGVVNQIAAGEVIERPASVVKELLENSIDALATRIEVDLADGGRELIRIADDGEGIHRDDLRLAVTSHATSKIRSADDLFRVRTLGFRGEALASIAAVSRLRVISRTAEAAEGTELVVDAGRIGSTRPCGCAGGTVVEVAQLFKNMPVRRKFLKSPATEFAHVAEQFVRIALPHARLRLVLRHDGKVVYDLPPAAELQERLRLFFGSELADRLIWVDSQVDSVRLWGYVAHPSQTKATRKGQHLFLNGRWIQDRALGHALGEAYRGLVMTGRYPVAFLFLEMPPEEVDVNVHPTKTEVRFRESQQLYRHLLSTLRTKFLGMDLQTGMRIPPMRATAAPAIDAERQRELQMDFASWAKEQLLARVVGGPAATEAPRPATATETSNRPEVAEPRLARQPPPHDPSEAVGPAVGELPSGNPADGSAAHAAAESAAEHARVLSAPLRAMQVHDCYLVVETAEGLTVIDQHALHERILYEQLRRRVLAGALESQRLLVPVAVECSPAEVARLSEHRSVLEELGFGVEEFGRNTVLVNRYPALLERVDLKRLVHDLAEQLSGAGKLPTRRDILDSLLHLMSCRAAIKAGHRLSPAEIDDLLAQRHLVDDAHHCPHGRPTALTLTRETLDRQFGRLG